MPAARSTTRRPKPGALLLAPGAGATRDHHTLLAIDQAVAPLPCRRVDFPSRIAGRRTPDRPPVAVAHLRTEAEALATEATVAANRVVLGGRSFGGRMCSLAVAEGTPAAGLILLSYPLHPPGRPDRLRVEHLPAITVPVLFVSGTSDPFGSPEEFDAQVGAIAGPVTQVRLPGGHDPRGADERICEIVLTWLREL